MTKVVTIDPEAFLQEVRERITAIFTDYHNGNDVPPGMRLRLEGFIQAGLRFALVDRSAVEKILVDTHQQVFGAPMPESFPSFDEADQIIPIPPLMQRAPVYPSTKD